jgi:hypothetical protein
MPLLHSICINLLNVVLLCIAILCDVAFYFNNWCLPIPITIALYACMLVRAPKIWIIVTLLTIATLPLVLVTPWWWFMLPVLIMTAIGLYARRLIYHVWAVPYLLVIIYLMCRFGLSFFRDTQLYSCGALTICSFFIILTVIITSSLFLTSSRQGNRV